MTLFAAAASIFLSFVDAQGSSPTWDARLTLVEGEVTVIYHDQDKTGVSAEEGMLLEAGDVVKTGPESRAEIGLEADSAIELDERSEFKVTALDRTESAFFLETGAVVLKILNLLKDRGKLRVQTPTAIAAVRGTEFAVEYKTDGETAVAVFDEGSVAVRGLEGDGGEVTLSKSEETSVMLGRMPEKPRPLERLIRHRARMAMLRRRAAGLRRAWRAVPVARRRAMRQEMFERRRRIHRQIQQKRRQIRENRKRNR